MAHCVAPHTNNADSIPLGSREVETNEEKTDQQSIKVNKQQNENEKNSMFCLKYTSENKMLQECFDNLQKNYLERCKPPPWLMDAEYPFKWLMSIQGRLINKIDVSDKMDDYKNQGADYGFEKVCYLLTSLFVVAPWMYDTGTESCDESSDNEIERPDLSKKDEDESNNKSERNTNIIYKIIRKALDEMASNEGNVMYMRIGAALEHVVAATRAHMLYRQGDIASSQEIAKNLQPITEMTIENQAGIEGIKGKFFLCFYRDLRKPLECTLKALEMDPSFAAWYYQAGKILRRLRREYKEDIVQEEVDYFEKAVKLERIPKYIVFLAQAYLELSFHEKSKFAIDDLRHKAAELFRESWDLQKDCTTICRRIGNGMMKLSEQPENIELAKAALKKSIEIHANKVTIHQLGLLFYKFVKDDEAALECFLKVKELYGTSNAIRLQLIRDPSYDPIELITYWRKFALTSSKRDLLYCDIGWYYLFFQNELDTAAKRFWHLLMDDYNSFRVLKFESFAFCVTGPLNMLEVLVNEILLTKESNELQEQHETDKEFFEQFLERVFEKHPHMRNMKPRPNLKQSIKNRVDNYIAFLRRRRYGSNSNEERKPQSRWRRQDRNENDEVEDKFERNYRRRMDSQGYDNEEDKHGGNWRQADSQGPDKEQVIFQKNWKQGSNPQTGERNNKFCEEGTWRSRNNSESETSRPRSDSREYERSSSFGRDNNYVLRPQQGSSQSDRRNQGSRGRQNNNSRYDLTVTDWRRENK